MDCRQTMTDDGKLGLVTSWFVDAISTIVRHAQADEVLNVTDHHAQNATIANDWPSTWYHEHSYSPSNLVPPAEFSDICSASLTWMMGK